MSSLTKNLAVGIVIGIVVGIALGYSVSLGSTNNLERRIGELEEQVISLEDAIASKNTEISNLQSETNEKDAQMSELQAQITSLQHQVSSKNDEIGSLQSQISEKDASIYDLQNQMADLQFQISFLEQQLETEILGIYFSPRGGCEDQVLYWISRANESIHILIYSFTLDSIGNALLQAHTGGVEVQVVFETSQISQYSEYQRLKDAGITVRTDTNPNSMHDKVMVVDGIVVLTGSFNWSDNGENNNNENLIVIECSFVAAIYEGEFTKIWDQSQPSDGNGGNGEDGEPTEAEVVIDYVHYDAAGNDWDNLNDEYVVLWNTGSADADLTGWELKDEVDHTYTFPTFTLRAGEKVTVYTGSGTNTRSSLHWGSNSPIWNNDSDTAYLYNQGMELMDSYGW